MTPKHLFCGEVASDLICNLQPFTASLYKVVFLYFILFSFPSSFFFRARRLSGSADLFRLPFARVVSAGGAATSAETQGDGPGCEPCLPSLWQASLYPAPAMTLQSTRHWEGGVVARFSRTHGPPLLQIKEKRSRGGARQVVDTHLIPILVIEHTDGTSRSRGGEECFANAARVSGVTFGRFALAGVATARCTRPQEREIESVPTEALHIAA